MSIGISAFALLQRTVAGATLCLFLTTSSAFAQDAVSARSADALVESIGVNVHFGFNDTKYYTEFDAVSAKLDALGVRYVRDAVYDPEGWRGAPAIDLHGRTGIQLIALMGDRVDGVISLDPAVMETSLDLIEEHYNDGAKRVVAAFEGPNEYDTSHEGDTNWAQTLQRYQHMLFTKVNARPTLSQLPVIGPSIVWSVAEAGDFTGKLDALNMHPYPGGRRPTNGLQSNIDKYQPLAPAENEFWVTETGYHNALGDSNVEGGYMSQPGVPEEVEAKYLPRLYTEYFRRGIVKTFSYEFIDLFDNPENHHQEHNFGLLRNDLSEKPVYRSLQNTIALLEDPAPSGGESSFSPGTLSYELTGETADVHQVLLQKRDGRFFLVLWQDVSSYEVPDDWKNGEAGTILHPDPAAVTLRLDEPVAGATVYRPLDGTQPVGTLGQGQNFSLDVPDHLTIVELRPASTGEEDSGEENTSGGGDDEDSALSVSSFTLVNADTDEDVGPLSEGDIVDLSQIGTPNLSVRATASHNAGSVRFVLDDENYQTESHRPYAIAGDAGHDDYHAWTPAPGTYQLSVTPFAEAGARGEEGAPLSATFTVIEGGEDNDEGEASSLTVDRLMLVNADTNEDLQVLSSGAVIDLDALPTENLSIRADASAETESVRFGLDGDASYKTESVRPFSIAGDRPRGNYIPWTPEVGEHALRVTPFSASGASGQSGEALTLTLTVERGAESHDDGEVVFAVNAGGEAFTGESGQRYQADTGYEGGRTYATSAAIEGTSADALYQSERYGAFSYAVPLEDGLYEVVFQLAEIYHETSGRRLFDVSLEGEEQISDLDLFAQAGINAAYDVRKTVQITDGALNLAFDADVNNAKLSALLVRRLSEGGGECMATEEVSVSAEGLPLRFFGTPVGTRRTATLGPVDLGATEHATLTVTANDIDAPAEAAMFINGTEVEVPAALAEDPGGDSDLLTATAEVERSLLEAGENEVAFEFASDLGGTTGGYEVTELRMTFTKCAAAQPQTTDAVPSDRSLAKSPETFALEQNYPNPFSERTSIRFALPEATRVRIVVYDLLGRQIATPVDEKRSAGMHTVKWNAGRVASGVYVYRIKAGGFSDTRKMVLAK